MSSSAELVAKVKKYMKQLEKEEKVGRALSRLDKIEMSMKILRKTAVGKALRPLCHHDIHGAEASRILQKWIELAKKNGVEAPEPEAPEVTTSVPDPEVVAPVSASPVSASPTPVKASPKKAAPVKAAPVKAAPTKPSAFMDAINSGDSTTRRQNRKRTASPVDQPSKSPKLDSSHSTTSPTATPPSSSGSISPKQEKENFNTEAMFKAKSDRIKVFAGRRKANTLTEVPSLVRSCLRVLSSNINALEDTKGASFEVLRPVLVKCSPEQLKHIEKRNKYLKKETKALWENYFKKSFYGQQLLPRESYKRAYFRLKSGSEDRLKMLSKKIKISIGDGKTRTTIAIDSKPVASSGKRSPGETSKAQLLKPPTKSPVASVAKKSPPKKGALMIKAMKMYNCRRR